MRFKLQAASNKRQATSVKHVDVLSTMHRRQAASCDKLSRVTMSQRFKVQAASVKPQATSIKLQATRAELFNIFSFVKFRDARSERLYYGK
jgi:hypothetical protein